jgi:hypothetical protein
LDGSTKTANKIVLVGQDDARRRRDGQRFLAALALFAFRSANGAHFDRSINADFASRSKITADRMGSQCRRDNRLPAAID